MPTKFTAAFAPAALTFLRVLIGVDFFLRGLPKIQHPAGAANLAAGVHLPAFMGWFPTVMEPVGGILLILGLGTRWVSLYFMAEMIVTGAVSKFMLRGVPFIMPGNRPGVGFELDALLFAGAFVLVVFGAGPLAVDRLLAGRTGRVSASPVSAAR